MNDDAECVLKLLRHALKMIRAKKNQKQREIFEIDRQIEGVLLKMFKIQNQLRDKSEVEDGTRI